MGSLEIGATAGGDGPAVAIAGMSGPIGRTTVLRELGSVAMAWSTRPTTPTSYPREQRRPTCARRRDSVAGVVAQSIGDACDPPVGAAAPDPRFVAPTYVSTAEEPPTPDAAGDGSVARAGIEAAPAPEDRYEVVREFARGGLGSVTLARDRALDRPVALKQLLRATATNRARFLREIKFTARLQHPGIVPIYEAGNWSDGEPFYAMKMVHGRTLAEAARQAATLEERLALLPHIQAVADAIAYAHDQRIIHRDIKPHNIIVGDFGETVIIDWGAAKDLRAPTSDPTEEVMSTRVTDLTVIGAIVGTPAYMPPEQADGDVLDERADVYALGATLYHVLAGAAPFRGGAATTIAELRRQQEPRPILEEVPGVPLDLAAIVTKAMARRREDRYPSAKELARDLQRFTTGQLIGARQYSRRALFGRWLRRNRRLIVVVSAAVVALIVTAAVGFMAVLEQRNQAQAARAVAEARSNTMTLAQARSSMREDPSEAAAWLASYPLAGEDWPEVFALTQVAESLGVARHVVHLRDCSDPTFSRDGLRLLVRVLRSGYELRALADGTRIGSLDIVAHALPLPDGPSLIIARQNNLEIAAVTGGSTRLLAALRAPIDLLALAPSARFAAAGFADGGLALVELDSGAVTEIAGHAGPITGVHVEADDDHVLTIGSDGALRRSSRRAGVGVALARGDAGLLRLAVSADAATAVLADADGRIFVVDLRAPTEALPPSSARLRLPRGVPGLGVSADGRHFAAIDGQGHLTVRERHTDRELAPPWPAQRSFGLGFAPADASLAVTGHDGVVRVWNLDTDFFAALTGEATTYGAPAFTPDGRHLATCAMNTEARVWPTPDLRARVLRGHESRSMHVRFLPDGRLASDSDDRSVRVWDPRTGGSQVVALHQDRVYGLTVAPDGRLADSGHDGVARVWDPTTGASTALTGHEGRVRTVAFMPDGGLVTAGNDGTIRLWDRDGRPGRVLRGHDGVVVWLVVNADGIVVSTGADGTLRRWSTIDGSHVILGSKLNTPDNRNLQVALLADESRVVACHGPQALAVWRIAGGEPRVFPAASTLVCSRTTASPDGRTVAIPTEGSLQLLDLESGAWRTLDDQDVHNLRFSADGRLLATANLERFARVWRIADEAATIVHRTDSAVLGVDFSPDGRLLAASTDDGSVWVGPIDEARFVPREPTALHARLAGLTTAKLVPGGGIVSAD